MIANRCTTMAESRVVDSFRCTSRQRTIRSGSILGKLSSPMICTDFKQQNSSMAASRVAPRNSAVKMLSIYLIAFLCSLTATATETTTTTTTINSTEELQSRVSIKSNQTDAISISRFDICKTQLHRNKQIVTLDEIVFEPEGQICSSWTIMVISNSSTAHQTMGEPWKSIEVLDVSGNHLTALRNNSGLSKMANLLELRLDSNQLSSCESEALVGLSRLKMLNLSHNKLDQLPSGLFDPLELLEQLNLSNNQLTSLGERIFDKLLHLVHLDLSANKLSTFTSAQKVVSLQTLVLQSNLIENITEGSAFNQLPSSLKVLNLLQNPIKNIDQSVLERLTNLQELKLEAASELWSANKSGQLFVEAPQVALDPNQRQLQSLKDIPQVTAHQSSRSSPVLRPSIEEVASKLSRKYLNLEHHKQEASVNNTREMHHQQQQQQQQQQQRAARERAEMASGAELRETTLGQQQETELVSTPTAQPWPGQQASGEHLSGHLNDPYLVIHTSRASSGASESLVSSSARNNSSEVVGSGEKNGHKSSRAARKKKVNGASQLLLLLRQEQASEPPDEATDELLQCQKFLTLQGKRTQTNQPVANMNDKDQLFDHQLLLSTSGSTLLHHRPQSIPCSCERRAHFATQLGYDSSFIWLNCDNVQLIGYGSHSSTVQQTERVKVSNDSSTGRSSGHFSSESAEKSLNDEDRRMARVEQFSQRNSGLQVLFAQKFYLLDLQNLKSIDLGQNRLREIRMDAFHGLESTLEYLNLGDNLLGDSRLLYSEKMENLEDKGRQNLHNNQENRQTKNGFTLHTNELSRLRALKWLSLAGNQIIQLSGTIFVQKSLKSFDTTMGSGQSQLVYLDLSENLLKSVPSVAIEQLNKLQHLSLRGNRITHLDESSKFPQSLKYLDLSENSISNIRHCDLIDLPDLIEINLSHNLLRQIDVNGFVSSSSTYLVAAAAAAVEPHPQEPVQGDQHKNLVPSGHHELEPRRRRRRRRQASDDGLVLRSGPKQEEEVELLSQPEKVTREEGELNSREDEDESLESSESIFSALKSQLGGSTGISLDQIATPTRDHIKPIQRHFNSTLRLNLSYNLFESVPGDTLLKFSRIQVLDLSFNRIRSLDSNYFCSIYNLVDNLRQLNLSGNLMFIQQESSALDSEQHTTEDRQRHLNKLFGCLQKLEVLMLSTNRLASNELEMAPPMEQQAANSSSASNESLEPKPAPPETLYDDQMEMEQSERIESGEQAISTAPLGAAPAGRLSIKFGETFGCRLLTVLDLSDNQLRLFPKIEQVAPQRPPIEAASEELHPLELDSNRSQLLDEWMLNSRAHLQTLLLDNNYIERLDENDFEHLFGLRQLQLSHNKISSLPAKLFRRFTALEQVTLAGNRLSSIEPLNELFERSIRSLRVLNLADNWLVRWPEIKRLFSSQEAHSSSLEAPVGGPAANYAASALANGTDFGQQQAHQQRANVIDFALEELYLQGNLLTSANVSSLFDQLTFMRSLKILNLSYNVLNKIRSDWFKWSNGNLQQLYLMGNKINSIDLGAFAMNQLDQLTHLSLEFNLLKELKRKTFDAMPRLSELNLANNLIHTINSETFHQLSSLKILKLNNNKLTSWKCEYFSNLCNSISGNINADLATLLLNGQQTKQDNHQTGSTTTTTTVSTLTSGTNPILMPNPNPNPNQKQQQQQQQQQQVSWLVELDLSHNSLSQLRANSIAVHTKLAKLDLSYNKLSFIPHDLFKATTSISPNAAGRQVHLVSSLRYLNLAHNRIQTIDNINFKPLGNLVRLDLSFNELQSLGADIVSEWSSSTGGQNQGSTSDGQTHSQERSSSPSTGLDNSSSLLNFEPSELYAPTPLLGNGTETPSSTRRAIFNPADPSSSSNWPSLAKLRHLNLAHNSLMQINQSILAELGPFVALNLNLSHNLLESAGLPVAFFTKSSQFAQSPPPKQTNNQKQQQQHKMGPNYELVFTMRIESIDLSHNRLSEYPSSLLDSHYFSMESCNLSHNRIQLLPRNSNSLIQIKTLDLQFNPLSRESNELILFEPRSARRLNLAATRQYAIQQATMENLSSIILTGNNKFRHTRYLNNQPGQLDLIRSISKPIDAPYLRHLNLSSNQIVWLAANVFDKLTSLQVLDLSHNQLTRVHLLNQQLGPVSSSLEQLSLGSNLFTNIEQNDFGQLSQLKQLDLSNLLSLQKLDCRFLAHLHTLRGLKMFNYPQLRHHLQALLAMLDATSTNGAPRERLKRHKMIQELMMSTIGRHCFQASGSRLRSTDSGTLLDLEQLELELFNDFSKLAERETSGQLAPIVGGFRLEDQLHNLIGSRLKSLTLVGLNLTSISAYSLLGVASEELRLKMSYTSLVQLPLREILSSVAKRTRLELDFRHNNIQTIDMGTLQWLDELSRVNSDQAPHTNTAGQLQLAQNPFRCDCNVRPLWLWLNQRWQSVESASSSLEEVSGSPETTNSNLNANYWLKFHSLAQASDLRCFFPLKLRGKMAQHVHYNDLVCKTAPASGPHLVPKPPARDSGQRRRSNESFIRSSDSYYLTSLSHQGATLLGADPTSQEGSPGYLDDDLDEESAGDLSEERGQQQAGVSLGEPPVRVTRFNRYPSALNNATSMYFVQNFPLESANHQLARDQYPEVSGPSSERAASEAQGRIGKRQQSALERVRGESSLARGEDSLASGQQQAASGLRPARSHSSVPTFRQSAGPPSSLGGQMALGLPRARVPLGQESASVASRHSQAQQQQLRPSSKSSLLTEFDLMVLTFASIAMICMAFLILGVCLFRYSYDQNDEERILGAQQGRLVVSSSASSSQTMFDTGKPLHTVASSSPGHSHRTASSSLGEPNSGRSRRSKQPGGTSGHAEQQTQTKQRLECPARTKLMLVGAGQQPPVLAPLQLSRDQLARGGGAPPGLPFETQQGTKRVPNFLMRSPTIRRVHGLASSAAGSVAAKYAKLSPSSRGTKRRRLFLRNTLARPGLSQLSTAKMATYIYQQHEQAQLEQQHHALLDSLGARSLPARCPAHCALDTATRQPRGLAPEGVQLHSFGPHAKLAAAAAAACQLGRQEQQQCAFCDHLLGSAQVGGTGKSTAGKPDDGELARLMGQQGQQGQQGAFMSPQMIQSLARRLDERHLEQLQAAGAQQTGAPTPSASQRPSPRREVVDPADLRAGLGEAAEVAPERSHFARLARTKTSSSSSGSSGSGPKTVASGAGGPPAKQPAGQRADEPKRSPAGLSQIPSQHVDGRFVYRHSEGAADELRAPTRRGRTPTGSGSGSEQPPSPAAARRAGALTPSSTAATNREDIFVLVRDTPSRLSEASGSSEAGGRALGQRAPVSSSGASSAVHQSSSGASSKSAGSSDQGHPSGANSNVALDIGSLMQDECSRTSSPVAYGFMRSSPSATTVSSSTLAACAQFQQQQQQQQGLYVPTRSPELAAFQNSRPQPKWAATFARTKRSSFLGGQDSESADKKQAYAQQMLRSIGMADAQHSSSSLKANNFGQPVDDNNNNNTYPYQAHDSNVIHKQKQPGELVAGEIKGATNSEQLLVSRL